MVTAPITADAVLKVAASKLGIHEDPPGSNHNPFGKWYGMDGQPWCAMYVSEVLHEAGWSDFAISTPKGYSYCPDGVAWFKKQGAWAGADVKPEPGWVVFYQFEGSVSDHTGLVKSAAAPRDIRAYEGNTDTAGGSTGGQVMEQHRTAGILGYGVITYQPSMSEEDDDMPFIAQLTDDLTGYAGGPYPKGYAVEVIGQVRHHISADQFNERVANGRKVVPMSSNEMTDLFDMTVIDVHRLIKT